ncbi:HPr family phosphocarrier protein [Candidatus Electronema sp. TJ]|uniref:HPr family phosphocarrier protein n=1 Tax=Candidatus Electronema sp. TJ TaxID=3401573 RepID=UPI003AA888C7
MSQLVWESRVSLPKGVHCRVAAKLSETAAAYDATVRISSAQGETADCSSVLELLSLALVEGSMARCTAEGPQAAQAAQAIDRLLSAAEES